MKKSPGAKKSPFSIFFWLITLVLLVIIFFKPIARKFLPVKYIDTIKKYSSEYSLDEHLVMAVIRTESKFNKDAVSHKNAKGLMQLKEDTAKWCVDEFDIASDIDLLNPETNIRIGCAYLRYLIDKFGNVEIAIAAYNAGEGNVSKWLESGSGTLEMESIPFGETKRYVDLVLKREKIYHYLY